MEAGYKYVKTLCVDTKGTHLPPSELSGLCGFQGLGWVLGSRGEDGELKGPEGYRAPVKIEEGGGGQECQT